VPFRERFADRDAAELSSKWPFAGPSRIPNSGTPRAANRTRPYRDVLSDRSSIAPLALTIASIVSATAPSVVLGDAHTRIEPLSAPEEHALKVKDTFRECDKCPEMVVAPAGSFIMGSPDTELNRAKYEGPQHRVTFARQFAVGKFAVTFDEWDACVRDGGCSGYSPNDESWGRGRRPVIKVSWNDANAYVKWLSAKTGKIYRLLSEAEREYVARAEARTAFWWGPTISPRQANYNGTYIYGNGPTGEYRQRTVSVDSFRSNRWGIFQVHGNVWEWTQDCWHKNYVGAPAEGSPWESGRCDYRIVRGGSWATYPGDLRSAVRGRFAVDFRSDSLGFRVGRTL
jgi:formylglycine-generating enzyme required for sulfatase activity